MHHLGIQTHDLAGLVRRMTVNGVRFRKAVSERADADYVMVVAPDGVLLKLFTPHRDRMPRGLDEFFGWPEHETT